MKTTLQSLKLVLAVFFVFLGANAFGQSTYIDNTSGASSFTVPAGVTTITVEIWGGGGAGGGSTKNNQGGSGGGSGGYSTKVFAVTGGQVINYTTGTGGVGGAGTGGNGTSSTITLVGTLTANGGSGGAINKGTIGAGGTATGGTTNTTGNNGAIGTTTGNKGGDAPAAGGTGGTGGRTNNDGRPGNAPGGGGGGGEADRFWGFTIDAYGGNGGDGGIKITYTCPTFSAGPNQTLTACATTATLNATLTGPATGAWTKISGSGNVTSPTLKNSGVTGIVPGTPLVLRWTVTNGNCGVSYSDVTITSPAGSACVTYCTPTATNDDATGIRNVNFNMINNTSPSGPAYSDFSTISTTVLGLNTYPLNVKVNTGGDFTVYAKAWIDWNNNGVFTDTGEEYDLGNATDGNPILTNGCPLNILVPNITGNVRMRVRASYGIVPTPCGNINYSEAEDYSIVVTAPPVCAAPTTKPTVLNLTAGTPDGTAINGFFTAAPAPVPNSYLVVVSTSNVAPTPVNGITYTIGGNVGAGYNVVDTDSNTTFLAGGLNPSTLYYFYIYSVNNLCSGGPKYYNNPLTGNRSTGNTIPTYPTAGCPATTTNNRSELYIDDLSFLGMFNGDIKKLGSSFNDAGTYKGYQDWTSFTKSQQIQGEGVTVSFRSNNRGTWKAWVDWNKDGDFTDLGELVYDSKGVAMNANTFGFIIPKGATPGDYRIRIRVYNGFGPYSCNGNNYNFEYSGDLANHFNSCTPFTNYKVNANTLECGVKNITINEYGEAEDYLFTVIESCDAQIKTVTNGERCAEGTVNLAATGTVGTTGYKWYDAQTGGILKGTTSPSGNWTTPSISSTTSYWVAAYNGTCESKIRREVVAKVNPLPTILFTPTVAEVCGEDIQVSIAASGDKELKYLIDENFENGGLGVFSNNFITNTTYDAQTAWQNKTSTLVPTGSSWYPAISSNFGGNHFALVTSDIGVNSIIVENALVSPMVNSNTFSDLTLSFRMYYSRYLPDPNPNPNYPTEEYMQVEVSTGAGWTSLLSTSIVSDQGIGTKFKDFSVDMSGYLNQSNLQVRIRYYANDWYDGAAVDDIKLYGNRPLTAKFTWTGPASTVFADDCSSPIPVGGSSSACIKPLTGELDTAVSWVINANATLGNGCTATGIITINNNNKVWNSASTDWNSATSWLPNDAKVPTLDKCVIIKKAVTLGGTGADGFAKNITIIPGGSLTIATGKALTVTNEIVNDASAADFVVESDANLLQDNDLAVNTGSITAKRILNLSIARQQYNYLISPLEDQILKDIYNAAGSTVPFVLYHNEANNRFYNSSGAYIKGRGLAVKEPTGVSFPIGAKPITATFIGKPTNGAFTYPIVKSTGGAEVDRGFNLIGNPYPSNIDLIKLFSENGGPLGNIESSFFFWDNKANNTYVQAGDLYGGQAYGTFNATTPPTDGTGTAGTGDVGFGVTKKPTRYVKTGQGFMVRSKIASATVKFNKSMRTKSGTTDFFGKNINKTEAPVDRYWLNMISPMNIAANIAIVYFPEGNNTFTQDDSRSMGGSDAVYSIVDNEQVAINGRSSFVDKDVIPLGSKHFVTGNYTIALDEKEGIFANGQNIYLKDKQTGIVTNLSEGNYTFAAIAGESTGRFEIIYKPETILATGDVSKDQLVVYKAGNDFVVKSSTKKITALDVYDAAGRLIYTAQPMNTEAIIPAEKLINSVYVVKIDRNGEISTKKIIK